MSWLNKVEDNFTITTGDGISYTVDWGSSVTKTKDYFIAEFNFPQLAGSLVNRGQPRGARYNLEIFFQGENNIENSRAFERSSDNLGYWKLSHPLYGLLFVHPVGLMFDNSNMNVTIVTGQLIETITNDNPITTVDPIDQIQLQKENLDATASNSLSKTPSSTDVNNLTANNNSLYKSSIPIIKVPEELTAYFNAFQVAKSAINNATQSPLIAMRTTQSVISAPAQFTTSVVNRLGLLTGQYATLKNQIVPKNQFQSIPVSTKQIFQIQGSTLISSQLLAVSTPQPNDYTNAKSVYDTINIITNNYNQFLIDMDSIQSVNGGSPDSFIPDADTFIALSQLANNVISNLFQIALLGKRERSILLDKDTNLIVLTHKLYGLDEFDNNMDELMANNNWGFNQLIQIKKNTIVKYYI